MLQDAIQSSGLSIFAQIGLVTFVVGFLAVVARIWLIDADEARENAEIPLDDATDESVQSS